MKHCPVCNAKFEEGRFCPDCGETLVEDPAMAAPGISLNLGDANAISGGVNFSDSHNVSNVDNSVHNMTTNNSTVNNITNNTSTVNNINVHKSESEILQERKIEFMEVVKEVFADGILEKDEIARLENERLRIGLDEVTAKRLIETVRKNNSVTQNTSLTPSQSFLLKQIKQLINTNQVEQLKRQLPRLEAVANNTLDEEAHYYYYLALAAVNPQKMVEEYETFGADDYWKSYWAYIAYSKLCDFMKAEDVLYSLARYTQYSEENATLLTAVGAMREFWSETATDFLNTITGMYSSCLEDFVVSIYRLVEPDVVSDDPESSKRIEFYLQNLLQFEDAEERARREAEEQARMAAENAKLYNLRLNGAGPNSFKVAMVIKSGLNVTLSEAKALVEVCPIDIVKQQPKAQIQPLMSALQNAGANVELL